MRIGEFVSRASRSRVKTLLAFLVFFSFVEIMQRLTGGLAAGFGLYPDEPAHYVSSLLVRDYLVSGFHQTPIAFAVNYYAALPYFAIGYWPPAFYALAGVWMLVFGVHRASALALIAVVVALLAATVFRVLYRQGMNGWAAGAWALPVLLVPQLIDSSSMYMLDLPVALFSMWALIEEIRFSKAPGKPRHATGYALCASLAFLTKYSGAFVFLFPIVLVLGARKWNLLRDKWFWAQPAIAIGVCGPWVLYTHRLMHVGLPPGGSSIHQHLSVAIGAFVVEFLRIAGPVLAASAATGVFMAVWKRRWDTELLMYAAAPVCVILFLLGSPVDPEGRYFLPALAPLILLIACSFERLEISKKRIMAIGVPALLVVAGAFRCATRMPHFSPDRLWPVVQYVNANPNWKKASILLPPDCEGPAIAEFTEYARHRPSHMLLRPSKILGVSSWWGIARSRYQDAAQLEQTLVRNSVGLIIADRLASLQTPVDSVIRAVTRNFPGEWERAAVIRSRCGQRVCGLWDIYVSTASQNPGASPVFRQRTLNRFEFWRKTAK